MKALHATLAGAMFGIAATQARAIEPGPVYSPHVEQDEWELEARSFTVVDKKSEENGLWNHHYSLGYGVTSWWWTEIVAEYEKPRPESGSWEAFEWETRFQFTEPGQYWVDAGGIVELEKARTGNGKELKLGLLFEKDIEETTLKFNGLLERAWGDDASSKWEQQYRAQWRWRYVSAFEPLVELQADEHAMNAGPGFTGKVKIGGRKLAYTTAWLFRTTGDTPQNLVRFELELEF